MKDEWVKAALSDDSLVVDLLFRLKNSSSSSQLLPKSLLSPSLFLPQGWGKRLPRSRSTTVFANAGKKDAAGISSATRRSPTTPLSWSGGGGGVASPSDGNCDGQSDSSRAISDLSRSKVESTNISGISKNSRKKKEFCDLKEEERGVSLSKESMQMTNQQKRTRSQNAKRIKLDTGKQRQENELVGTSCDHPLTEAAAVASTSGGDHTYLVPTRIHAKDEKLGFQSSCAGQSEVAAESHQHRRCLILPDLNTMPDEADEVGSEFVRDYRNVLAFSEWR